MPKPARIFVIHVSLRGIKTVWRRVVVPANVRLSALHRVIQGVMGWQDTHLHEFTARNGERFGVPEHDDFDPPQDEGIHKLDEFLARPRDKLRYTYDFGDSWEHVIELRLATEYFTSDPCALNSSTARESVRRRTVAACRGITKC